MRNSFKIWIPVLSILLTGCFGSEYSQMVKSEMESGVINDSLFLGLKLGQKKTDFFAICWELNQQKKVTNGDDMLVHYVLPETKEKSNTGDMNMLFYGIFDKNNTMTGMDLRFSYEAWSLWNKAVQANQLQFAVMDTLESWYPGNDFLKVVLDKSKKELWVKVDGNRRITIKPIADDKTVEAQIDDLRYVLEDTK